MLTQNIATDLLVELAPEEQQLLSGGCYQSPPPCCRKPKKCGGRDYPRYDQSNDQPMPYSREDSYPETQNKCGN
jgi:hypothetical protein